MRSERLKMTNSVEMAKIQDRVQKLLNMAKDASSPNEAMIAMERARRTEYQADQIVAKYAMGHGGLRPEAVCCLVKLAQA